MKNNKKAILWYRSDLRLHDHEAMYEALDSSQEIYPVYVFDERIFTGRGSYGFRKTDVFRAQFIIEAVEDLRNSLRKTGSDLIVRYGKPEEVVFQMAKELRTNWVFCNRERTQEEIDVQDSLEKNLWTVGQEMRYSRGKMLYYTADLPFPVTHTPDIYTQFRKEVEKIVEIRKPLSTPDLIPPFTISVDPGSIPALEHFGFDADDVVKTKDSIFKGGETEGLKRLNRYFWETDGISTHKDTRDGLFGPSYSSKFSPYLAHGCLSPKMIYEHLDRYKQSRKRNESTHHLFLELLWRDYFRLMGKKHGNAIFLKGGIKQKVRADLSDDLSVFKIWSEARTGVPFIDAAMKELATTGFMSNRARQNVASFLINDLHVNWQIGAEYFESLLVDYDPCSNWGNWNYLAGVGTDPRESRLFNIISQAKRYDPYGDFVRRFIPVLSQLPNEYVHQPYLLREDQQEDFNFVLGKDYPNACVRIEEH